VPPEAAALLVIAAGTDPVHTVELVLAIVPPLKATTVTVTDDEVLLHPY
jgi:hypothetical protein